MAGKTKEGRCRITLTVDDEALMILKYYAPGERGHGEFVSKLLWEHHARVLNAKRKREDIVAELQAASKQMEALAAKHGIFRDHSKGL
jgi:hypothetical protein